MTSEERRSEKAARLAKLPSSGHSRELRLRLRRAREKRNLTLQQVADLIAEYCGLDTFSASSVSHYESFRRHPPVDVFAGWSRAVGMRLVVDLVQDGSDQVAVPLSPRTARVARALEGADEEAFKAIEAIVVRMLPVDPEE